MAEFLCIGDFIGLYCEDTDGYVYSCNTSSVFNHLSIYYKQEVKKPANIPDPQVLLFQVSIQNRYKLNKKFKKHYAHVDIDTADHELKAHAKQAKAAADAENVDNMAEQRRNQGKKVRYGEVIQLKHVYSEKHIHVNTTQTSQRDKNNMMLSLHEYNAKGAQFRVLPRYKVKSEGEYVQIYDQITFESVKSPGHFFHSSLPYHLDNFGFGSELNLGVEQSGFTIVRSHSFVEPNESFVRGGQFVQLFHKELEAYIVAEGLFDDSVTEQVHLRIREIDQLNARTLRPSSSAITYWQIESEKTILNGDPFTWEQQFRFRHATTRMYLSVDDDVNVTLTKDSRDPRTVFKLHPVIQDQEEITWESYARIEHVLSGSWLHALKDQEYKRQQFDKTFDEMSMKALRWDGGELRRVACVHDRRYDDAYTIQKVQPEHVQTFSYVAGAVPFIKNLIEDRKKRKPLHAKEVHRICIALRELKDFMLVKGVAIKSRQKLLRNLRVIDIIVQFLTLPTSTNALEESNLMKIHKECYDILYTYMIGNSRKNALYFAKYIEMFQDQMTNKLSLTEMGLKIAQMIVELIRDNRKIVDRISRHQINQFVEALRTNQNHRYLELLEVLCVCNRVAIADNQSYIAQKWLLEDRRGVYLTERGQNIHEQPNILYISTDCMKTWTALDRFLDPDQVYYDEEKILFLQKQLDLFNALCYGRNEYCIKLITKELNYLTWEEAFLSLQSEILPDDIRAKYCELIIGLFVNVGNNYSVVDYPQYCFLYEYVSTKDVNKSSATADHYIYRDHCNRKAAKDLVTIFPALRDWITGFLDTNTCMIASLIKTNMLIEQVLRLLHYLVKFGYYGDVDDVQKLVKPLINLLDGRHDLPFPTDRPGKEHTKEARKVVNRYKISERFEVSPETLAIVKAKYAALEVLDIVLTFEENARLAGIISKFKECEKGEREAKKKHQSSLVPALYDSYDPYLTKTSALRKQKKQVKELKEMFELTSHVDIEKLTGILIDLAHYKYDDMNQMSLYILNKLYSARMNAFEMGLESLVLITPDSCRVHREVSRQIPLLRMMAKAKWSDEQVQRIETVLDTLIEFCHLPNAPEEPHPMNQRILYSHNVIGVVLEILSAETDVQLAEKYSQIEKVLRKAVQLIKAMTLQYADVQQVIFDHLDSLLRVKLVESDLAIALRYVFVNNQNLCLKILPRQIQRVVALAAENQEKAPEFLDLLSVIVKVEGPNLALKRNQTLVMKYIMQNYTKIAYILEQTPQVRESVLLGEMGDKDTQYLISLIDLLATCAEGENRYIESLCQTILGVEDLMHILNHPDIPCQLKRPFLRYLLYAYMKTTGTNCETGSTDILRDSQIWRFLENLTEDLTNLADYVHDSSRDTVFYMLTKPFPKSEHMKMSAEEFKAHATLTYFFDGILPFIQTFAGIFYNPFQRETQPEEVEIIDSLTRAIVDLCAILAPTMTIPEHLKQIIACLTQLVPKSSHSPTIMEAVVDNIGKGEHVIDTVAQMKAGNKEYYTYEIELNLKLKVFAVNCKGLYGGHNTVQAQLKIKSKREYTSIGSDDSLPLSEEFQNHLRCFIISGTRKTAQRYKLANLLVNQLHISSKTSEYSLYGPCSSKQRKEQVVLDIRCLQLLRAMIHNEERRLMHDWEIRTSEFRVKKGLRTIEEIQNCLNSFELCTKTLPHLANPSDIITKEVLSLQAAMLFNASKNVQQSLLDYFLKTREEVFFYAVRNRLQMSTANIKERRLLQQQQRARKEEAREQARHLTTTMTLGNKALKEIRMYETKMKLESAANALHRRVESTAMLNSRKDEKKADGYLAGKSKIVKKHVVFVNGKVIDPFSESKSSRIGLLGNEPTDDLELNSIRVEDFPEDEMDDDNEVEDEISLKDDGYVELVLKLLARVCDGQHEGLQTYLREQPDNIKSFNLVAEVAQFLNVVYSNINKDTIELVTQIFTTINEFIAGNQENRVTVYDNKIVDYINFILRAGEFEGCDTETVIGLRQAIANVVISLIEENSPEATIIAKEVKDTLDKEALYHVLTDSYEMHEKREEQKRLKHQLFDVGFSFYIIIVRLQDLDPNLGKKDESQPYRRELMPTESQQKAFKFYKKNACSVEILKGEHLQKITFRVKYKNVLREEVKEKLKWNVDRSSPSNKIRDFMDWSKAILEDIRYQRKIQHNPLAMFFTKGWLLWNYLVTILSVVLNVLMLVGYEAPPGGAILPDNTPGDDTLLPISFNETRPVWGENFKTLEDPMMILGYIHNILSVFIILTYLIADHPALPDFRVIKQKLCKKKTIEEEDDALEDVTLSTKMTASLFSFKTFYYIVFVALSFAGQFYFRYFFAFHLFNIVHNNQLLQGVISAVTQNGKSLIWVAILGIVIIYLYSIIAFSFFRSGFSPSNFMYCDTLAHCFVTVLRFGLVGDLFENMIPPDSNKSFEAFGLMVIFHVSFFILITTIGLNIIFGIIVDTFSELRDLKWTAESDMRDTCFICSRNSYDFEHHGAGFDEHVRLEHNMWAYIFFFIHLQDTKANDYTHLELHVGKLLGEEKYDFFPINRALCLTAKDEDSTDSKIDDLLFNVKELVRRQREEDTEKKKWEEILRQRRWQKRYRGRNSHEGSIDRDTDDDDDNNHGNSLLPPVSLVRGRSLTMLGYGAMSGRNFGSSEDFRRPLNSASSAGVLDPSRVPSHPELGVQEEESEGSADSDYDLGNEHRPPLELGPPTHSESLGTRIRRSSTSPRVPPILLTHPELAMVTPTLFLRSHRRRSSGARRRSSLVNQGPRAPQVSRRQTAVDSVTQAKIP